jgi:hypothetical protein
MASARSPGANPSAIAIKKRPSKAPISTMSPEMPSSL